MAILVEQYDQDNRCYRTFTYHAEQQNLDSKLVTLIRAYNMYHTAISYRDASGDVITITSNQKIAR